MIYEDKSYYTQKDFDVISFHDCAIHSMYFNDEEKKFFLDIDFITEWIINPGEAISFKVAPATLVFNNVLDMRIDIDLSCCSKLELPSIDGVRYVVEKNDNGYIFSKFIVDLHEGCIVLYSESYEIYLRKSPILSNMTLPNKERGVPSFDLIRYDD
ncbi:MAG: hypothetical protein AB7V16_13700 [Vulcanibacillus sp.]